MVTFYTANSLYDEWTELGDPVEGLGTTAIDSNATNAIRIFNNDTDTVLSALGTVYRVIILNGIDGAEELDINFLDTADNDIHTGTDTFNENGPNTLAVTIDAQTPGSTDFNTSRWLLLNHDGTDFFHFGASPDIDNSSNPDDLGDTLTVSGLNSANHQYVVTYTDDSTQTGALGTATSHILSSDDPNLGGKAIKQIAIQNVSGSTEVGLFLPSTIASGDLAGNDSYGRTWTLARSFEDGFYYEPSSSVDRSLIMPIEGEGIIRYGGFGFGASTGSFSYTAQSFSLTYRRFWDTASARTTVMDNTVDSGSGTFGWKVDLFEEFVEVYLFDGVVQYNLSWDETDRIGEWNNIVLNLDPANNTIELWANGELVDSTTGFFVNQFLGFTGASVDYASIADTASLDITGDIEVRVHAYSDDWFDAGNADEWVLLAAKEDSWELAFNQQDGLIRLAWVDGSQTTFTAATTPFIDSRAIHIAGKLDVNNGGGGYTAQILYSWDGLTWELLDEDVTAGGTVTLDTSNADVRVGSYPDAESFVGRVYSFKVFSGSSLVAHADFSNPNNWSITSVDGDDETGNHTVVLNGGATIQVRNKPDFFPDFFPLGMTVFESGQPLPFQFSQMAVYDHTLDEIAIEGLVAENNITV